jgi:hypothetical protein
MLDAFTKSSIMTWQHINVHMEYNFQELFNNGEMSTFEFERIKDLEIKSDVA